MTEAERAGHRVRTIHQALTGTDLDGTRYPLDEPDLPLWCIAAWSPPAPT